MRTDVGDEALIGPIVPRDARWASSRRICDPRGAWAAPDVFFAMELTSGGARACVAREIALHWNEGLLQNADSLLSLGAGRGRMEERVPA